MRTDNIDRLKTIRSMVRGFFEGLFSALIEKADKGNGESRSVLVKQLMMNNYENIAGYFTQAMFPIIARVNYDSLDDLSSKMKEKHVGDHTPLKLLIRMACGSKEAYECMTSEYRRQMEALLCGHIETPAEHLAVESMPSSLTPVPVPQAIRGVVRSMMQGYVVGIKATDGNGFQQKTILRMMINGMHTLLHDTEISDWGVNPDLDDIYRIVSKDGENYEVLINEMNQAYEDLANT